MTKGLQKKMTFVELTRQKEFGFTKNDSGMGILKKTSKRKENFFRMRLHKLIFHYKSHLFLHPFCKRELLILSAFVFYTAIVKNYRDTL